MKGTIAMSVNEAYVGLDLNTSGGDVITAIIEAIKEDNEGVVVEEFLGFTKVKAPKKMVINRETVEEYFGQDFDMDQLHIFMASYFGFIGDWDEDQLIIEWENAE